MSEPFCIALCRHCEVDGDWSAAMNDDFLHRIRVEPPPGFLARLKSRLDLQPPPTSPASRFSRLRNLAVTLLLSGSVFAITLLILNRGGPDNSVNTEPKQAPRKDDAVITPGSTASAKSAAPAKPTPARTSAKETAVNYTAITTKSLEPYLSHLTDTYFKVRGRASKIVATDSASDALKELCAKEGAAKSEQPRPSIALVARRLTQSESDTCARNAGHISETAVGYQALMLARSKLYGAFGLTPAEIFLALASKVPDPSHPDQLMPNPNTVWSDVNATLEREPIEVIGPSRSSVIGLALREILLETGCRSLPSMAAAKECPDLRSDGVYTEVENSRDIALMLQTKPNAIGILPPGNAAPLVLIPIGGVPPSSQAISNSTYPGSRPLYLYSSNAAWGPTTSYITDTLYFWSSGFDLQRIAVIVPNGNKP
jgi:phosphate transport system substrate-binding protein